MTYKLKLPELDREGLIWAFSVDGIREIRWYDKARDSFAFRWDMLIGDRQFTINSYDSESGPKTMREARLIFEGFE